MRRQRLIMTAVILLSLTVSDHVATAQSYTYQTIDLPFAAPTDI
jgi:hypothetical protein